jgi:hypothetical protein
MTIFSVGEVGCTYKFLLMSSHLASIYIYSVLGILSMLKMMTSALQY